MKSIPFLKVAVSVILICFFTGGAFGQVSIAIGTNSTLAVNGNMDILLSGDWTNNGTFVPDNGAVVFNGSQNQTVTNTAGENFNDVTVDKSGGDLVFANNAAISGNLSLTSGDVDLNGNIIILGTNALLIETAGNTVKGAGEIVTTRDLNAPTGLDVAGLGFEITTGVNLGSTVISRKHDVQTINSNASILRYYDVTSTNNSGLNATLVFHYDDSELNGRTESDLSLFRSIDTGSNWTSEGGTVNAGNNIISLSAIDAFSRWGATSSVGTPGLVFRVERATGNVYADGSFIPGGADLAERINVSEPVEPGDVVELDPFRPWHYRKACSNSGRVAGVITTEPGFVLGNSSESGVDRRPMLALLGRVPVKATTENGAIRPGDLLTVSSRPGYAMLCLQAKECEGTIIGKALEGLERADGLIMALVMIH